ncbi:MAG: hypothetical protein FJ100_23790 [Deltaproteobacteria bacterium]|nr:hypothetical protein [Deltaproteobacteria bacterium]
MTDAMRTVAVGSSEARVLWEARKSPNTGRWHARTGDRQAELEVADGVDLLLRLDAAVRAAVGLSTDPCTATPRLTVRAQSYSHGDLYELEEDTIWTVSDRGTPVWQFRGGDSYDYDGSGWAGPTGSHGVDEVVVAADGAHVLVREGGEVTCWMAP